MAGFNCPFAGSPLCVMLGSFNLEFEIEISTQLQLRPVLLIAAAAFHAVRVNCFS